MSNWLQKITASKPAKAGKRHVPAKVSPAQVPAAVMREMTRGLPPASIVYGTAAGAFFAFALCLFMAHYWLEGSLTLLPMIAFIGFAVHIARHTYPKK